MSLGKFLGFVVVATVVIVVIGLVGGDPKPTPPSPWQTNTVPPEQQAVTEAVLRARDGYRVGANEMAKGAERPARARALCAALRNPAVQGWVGKVNTLSTNNDGRGVLKVELGEGIRVSTWNNALSDAGHRTLIDPSSTLYNQAVRLQVGQAVRFSGSFFRNPGDPDCLEESSVSMDGSMRDPDFLFRFAAIEPL